MTSYLLWVNSRKIPQARTCHFEYKICIGYTGHTACLSIPAWFVGVTSPSSPRLKQSSPDATVVIEADGSESGKKMLKTMTWPLMDDDAVPSSYITKVLTCLSKWSVKMQNLKEVIAGIEDPAPSLKQFLELI